MIRQSVLYVCSIEDVLVLESNTPPLPSPRRVEGEETKKIRGCEGVREGREGREGVREEREGGREGGTD